MNCEHCNSIDLVPYMPGKLFCLTCQRITSTEGFVFTVIYPEQKESFEATI